MKSKLFSIIGALVFVAAVVVAQFSNVAAVDVVALGVAAFGLVAAIVGVITKAKAEETFSFKTIITIVLAVIGGALVCLGGMSANVLEQISGLVIALLAIILGMINANKTN